MENHPPLKSTADSPSAMISGNPYQNSHKSLDWSRSDIERRLGFRGGRFTSPGNTLSLIIALLLTAAFYTAVILVQQKWPQTRWFAAMFLERGPCPYPTMLLFFWALAMLLLKWRKLVFQRRVFGLSLMPQEPEFVLTSATAKEVRDRMGMLVDNPHNFVLFNRIDLALANLHNIGHTSDVAAILKVQAENDEAQIASSYGIIQGFMWGIPVLGFIGTVLGLSQAIGAFTDTLQAGGDLTAIRASLKTVTGGLATAFETTLVALVCAFILQLIVSFMQSLESQFLDNCNDVCSRQVAGKLRLQET
ncbi:MotA/TolQ/ExbB proton channel family protein [Prosthecobacter sp.]|jgi:biopolymer transport protein ExbB/TolQ|uniref:MotA/TolQ/ExbB proton channel family protein n=1 Tax=Prosthecobacter sp. TaxID=1965333 RepID=UPI0037C8A90A